MKKRTLWWSLAVILVGRWPLLAASNHPQGSAPFLPEGIWKGTLDVRGVMTSGTCYQSSYDDHLALTLVVKYDLIDISGTLSAQPLTGSQVGPCPKYQEGIHWSYHFDPDPLPMQAGGSMVLHNPLSIRWNLIPKNVIGNLLITYTQNGRVFLSNTRINDDASELPYSTPIELTAPNRFIVHEHHIYRNGPGSGPFPAGALIDPFQTDQTIEGEFHLITSQSGSLPKGLLAGLLAYLGLILAAGIMDPSAQKFISGFGGLVGLTEALGGAGFKWIAEQGRIGGFVGAALAESMELARIYNTSTKAGEKALVTIGRVGISLAVDLVSFAAGAAIMEMSIGVVATAVGFTGPFGAAIVGVGGAGVLMYGVSTVGDTVKEWANSTFTRLINK